MSETWQSIPAEEVRVGDRIRVGSGAVIEVSHIEPAFMGVDSMIAFIEDTPAKWFKQPMPKGTNVEIARTD